MNMSARISLVAAASIALFASSFVSCSGRENPGPTGGGSGTAGNTSAGGGSGTAGNTSAGGGTSAQGGGTSAQGGGSSAQGGGSSAQGGGSSAQGGGSGATGGGTGSGSSQIFTAKGAGFCSTIVQLRGVVVVAVQSSSTQTNPPTGNARQNFWVVDPASPRDGLYIFKDYTDTVNGTNNTFLRVGDLVNMDGYLASQFPNSGINGGAEAYRYQLTESCNGATPLQIVVVDAGVVVPDVTAPNPFGQNPDGGKPKGFTVADQKFSQPIAGARVHIPGPLTLSNAFPVEMRRHYDVPEGTYYGYELSGTNIPAGVLVRNNLTDGTPSDGGAGCDYRRMAADGGRMVSFPNGVRGVWDTWSQTYCYDAGVTCDFRARDAGSIQGLGANYTFVIYPQNCEDLAGAVVTP
ncbi:MAG: hypothetical protein JNK82_19215 [Myxococcaceae bacterium]|nr:hypothetical protein [Myxococcaceae bacterium]